MNAPSGLIRGRVSLMAALLMLAAGAPSSSAQIAYNNTVFVHGFASDGRIWYNNYSALGSVSPETYLGRQIALRNVLHPSLGEDKTYNGHLDTLQFLLSQQSGSSVLVGHSLGSIEARGDYVLRGDAAHVSALILLAPPHQGTRLADNAVVAAHFFTDVQRRVDDGVRSAKIIYFVGALAAAVTATVFHVSPWVVNPLFAGIAYMILQYKADSDLGLDALYQLLAVPAVSDLKTNSATIAALNNNLSDAGLPRVNIIATLPSYRNAAILVKASMAGQDPQATIDQRDNAVKSFKTCKVVGYFLIVTSYQASRCSAAAKVLGRIDEEWMGFVNGYDGAGRARNVPFDGIISNELSRYPTYTTLAFDTQVLGPNHQNIYSRRDGLDATVEGMRRVQMVRAPLTATSISGPGSVNYQWTRTWSVTPYWATPPYRYQWSGKLSGTNSFVTGNIETSGYLYADIWDATGQYVRKTLYVTVTTSCGGRVAC
jgi:pimeloyl-ACP methyl ester carboxylesterase